MELIVQCAWCRKFRVETDGVERWLELDQATQDAIKETKNIISHGICPPCKEKHFPGHS
jgi:hypothetical protein